VTTVLVGDRPRQLDSPLSLLRFQPLSVPSRLRLATVLAYLKLLPIPGRLELAEADAWMERMAGEEAHDLVWRPLLQGKFGPHYQRVSMAWLWARLHDRTTELGYLRGGFHQFYVALADAVERAGGSIRLGTPVVAIRPADQGLVVTVASPGHELIAFDRVISTLSPMATSRLAEIQGASDGLYAPLSAQCVVLALDRPLTGIYWIGSTNANDPFVAVVEHTALRPSSEYAGQTLVYLGAYRDAHDERLAWPLERLTELAVGQMRRLDPEINARHVLRSWNFTAPNAQPIVQVGYQTAIPPLETRLADLYSASMFHVFPHDRGQNYSIELAESLVLELQRGRR
jgi:protoporphyrinogen oxidase